MRKPQILDNNAIIEHGGTGYVLWLVSEKNNIYTGVCIDTMFDTTDYKDFYRELYANRDGERT